MQRQWPRLRPPQRPRLRPPQWNQLQLCRRHRQRPRRGVALIAVLLATVLLLALVAVLVDLSTVQLQKATADLRSMQAQAGADAGTAWVRAVLEQQHGDVVATMAKLATAQGKRRFTVDSQTYVVTTVVLTYTSQGKQNDHVDDNLEQHPAVEEVPVQVQASAAVYVYSLPVCRRVTTTLLRVFSAAPYSAVVGSIDNGSPIGIDSPGDAGGQLSAPDATELLVHAYTVDPLGHRQRVDQFGDDSWSDGNTTGQGALP